MLSLPAGFIYALLPGGSVARIVYVSPTGYPDHSAAQCGRSRRYSAWQAVTEPMRVCLACERRAP